MYQKLKPFAEDLLWTGADENFKKFFEIQAEKMRLTVQQIRNCLIMQRDFEMWDMPGLDTIRISMSGDSSIKDQAAAFLKAAEDMWLRLKNEPSEYPDKPPKPVLPKTIYKAETRESVILGDCPVASPRTRCCNLKTLDAVLNCGFACSYCSIQTFNIQNTVYFDPELADKLKSLKLDPEKKYHIGTGQSSDSLLWGNRDDMLRHLFDFAERNSNVVLELKTKSSNIKYLKSGDIPNNVIVTWSLNTDKIIENEEHGTATLEERINAAAELAARNIMVGFHFHPIILYRGWKQEYRAIAERLVHDFSPEQVCMVSMGTLTFIKPVIKALRARKQHSKVLQIPLAEAEGKFSYTFDEKLEMFSHVYSCFSKWHGKLFFYLCMEDPDLWKPVFGYEYDNNEQFEQAMINTYLGRIKMHNNK